MATIKEAVEAHSDALLALVETVKRGHDDDADWNAEIKAFTAYGLAVLDVMLAKARFASDTKIPWIVALRAEIEGELVVQEEQG